MRIGKGPGSKTGSRVSGALCARHAALVVLDVPEIQPRPQAVAGLLRHRPCPLARSRTRHQNRALSRKPMPCSALSLAGSLRVPSTPNATSGPRVQRTPVRHARPPVSESASPA